MDRRSFKNFITKRSSMWTLSLCMTGAIVLGGIAAVDHVRKQEDAQLEAELGDTAYLDEDSELFYTLDDDLEGNMSADIAANAEGSADDGTSAEYTDGADVWADSEAANYADGIAGDTVTINEDGSIAGESAMNENASANDVGASVAANANGSAADGSTVNADGSTVNSDGSVTANVDGTSEEASSANIISEQALLEAGVSFGEEASLMWPSAGTILIDYSMDSSVYFPTLNQYKYNPALVIGSEVGNQVIASAKGIVESITINEETGTTLVLNIGDGYRLTYGQLKELAVGQGDVVEAGAVLGYVSEPTKYYSVEGSNLYFKMTQGETPVDPVLYLE